MNRYSLKEHLEQSLKGYKTTLKAASLDSENGEHLCADESVEVYDFDRYVGERQKAAAKEEKYRTPASPDAIYVGEKHLYSIEFKNQKRADIDRSRIKAKFEDGTAQLRELLNGFAPTDCKYYFCVVHKGESSKFAYAREIESRTIRFGLEELNQSEGRFYDRVITQDVDFYKENFAQLKC